MRRDRSFLADVPFRGHDYLSIVQTDYPGAHDSAYRNRVSDLVSQAETAWPQIPQFDYRPEENETWAFIWRVLTALQDRYSCRAFLDGRDALDLPRDRLPQIDAISQCLEATTGVVLAPAGGLLEKSEFLGQLADRVLRCTPYVRHHAHPFFTPEPDILHEIVGHAPMFMHEPFVEISVAIGEATRTAVATGNEKLLDLIGLFYWFTAEYGLIYEDGEIKAFGAGVNGGIQDFMRSMDPTIEKRTLSMEAIQDLTIDYDAPQELFFVAESFDQVRAMAHELVAMA